MKLCLPMAQLQCLARYRLGGLHLLGRRHGVGHRDCQLCSLHGRPMWRQRLLARGGCQTEYLMHFMLECPALDHTREHFAELFDAPNDLLNAARLSLLFTCAEQTALVRCVSQMDMYRRFLLDIQVPDTCRIYHQPATYIPSHPRLQCSLDRGTTGSNVYFKLVMAIVVAVTCAVCLMLLR
jgi:hypothetical protein